MIPAPVFQTGSSARRSVWRENVEAILLAVALALFIRTFVVQAFKIPSGSMKDTLLIGDHILVNKFLFGIRLPYLNTEIIGGKTPERGDVVVFKYPKDPDLDFIKRVVAVGGDVVEIRDKKVYINDQPVSEDYTIFTDYHLLPGWMQPRDNLGPVRLPRDKLFVMGDNRDSSNDSRFWGFVDVSEVRGKAFFIYWSWNGENSGGVLDYIRWRRLGRVIH